LEEFLQASVGEEQSKTKRTDASHNYIMHVLTYKSEEEADEGRGRNPGQKRPSKRALVANDILDNLQHLGWEREAVLIHSFLAHEHIIGMVRWWSPTDAIRHAIDKYSLNVTA